MTPFNRLETIVHELYHLHPTMRGDLRRFPKPHIHHGPTPAAYNRRVKELTSESLKNSPFLKEHPLLKMNPSDASDFKKKRYSIPTHRFIPEPNPLSFIAQKAKEIFATVIFLTACQAQALIPVRLQTTTMLQGRPEAGSSVVYEGARGMRFQAMKQSADKKWVYLENSKARGWVPKERIQVMANSAGQRRSQNDDQDFTVDEDIESFDLKQSTGVAQVSTELYGDPSSTAERFSRVEKGDELQILGQSDSRNWYQVRLLVTGEEGWLPVRAIQLDSFDRVNRVPDNGIQIMGLVGTDSLGYGLGLGYFRNVFPRGVSGRPRDRLEFGLEGDLMFKNSSLEGFSVARRSFIWTGGMRYLPAVANGRFYGIAEVGLTYIYSTYSSDLSEATLIANKAKDSTHTFAFTLGAGLGLSINEYFGVSTILRMLLKSNLILIGGAGVSWRF
ncbi:hypothetical protein GW915_11110 [bacterium]|nr:hypothetical protein [bacterium]